MKWRNKQLLWLIFLCITGFCIPAIVQKNRIILPPDKRGDLRIMFYNTENYFDTLDDPITEDNEFLPLAQKKWTGYRFHEKTMNIFKTIAASGEMEPPEIIGFAEIENRSVLHQLITKTPLKKFNYKIIHFDSPDKRGIDVAAVYRPDKVIYIDAHPIRIVYPWDSLLFTRDILYFKCQTGKDTLHIFFNHWPSRSGGQKKTETLRIYVAGILKHVTDSLFALDPCSRIIIAGDFNDEPENKSIRVIMNALDSVPDDSCSKLVNLSAIVKDQNTNGTYRYHAEWYMFDQVIVSSSLLSRNSGIITCTSCLHIAPFEFLLIPDTKYGGYRPSYTYLGPVYKGGFSDHLPVFLDLFFK